MYFQKLRLDGRTAVVTGGASGIGFACVEALAEAGAQVVVADASDQNSTQAAAALSAKYGNEADRISFEKMDVTDPEQVETTARLIKQRLGKIDILVNCAGIGRQNSAETVEDAEWRLVLDINLNGLYWTSRAFGKVMLEQGSGSIVNIGSMSGEVVTRPQKNAHYNASKAGVHHLTRSLAAEWAGRNVRVNAVAPGFIETPMNTYALRENVETTRTWLSNTPMGRVGRTDEVASIVHFLASDAASYMTGAIVVADGGYTAW